MPQTLFDMPPEKKSESSERRPLASNNNWLFYTDVSTANCINRPFFHKIIRWNFESIEETLPGLVTQSHIHLRLHELGTQREDMKLSMKVGIGR